MSAAQLNEIKERGVKWVNDMLSAKSTKTKPGSINHLLYGEKQSFQSINIKLGKYGEIMSKDLIQCNSSLELLKCGVQLVDQNNKDVDLIWVDPAKQTIYYRELKGNIELDTEKLPATIKKCKEIKECIPSKYPQYAGFVINCGVLNWSVYNREVLTAGLSNIKNFEKNDITIDHMSDFLTLIDVQWEEADFYAYFRGLGNQILREPTVPLRSLP